MILHRHVLTQMAELGCSLPHQKPNLGHQTGISELHGIAEIVRGVTMLPKLESHRGSFMEFSSGTRVDIRKSWKRNWRKK